MNPSQLKCPACFQQYSEINPPRLLTMCGHTFCHHCIKSLIKKKEKGFKVKCPIDKTSIEMEKPNPSLFPKNIALITILSKPKNSQSFNEFLPINQGPKITESQKENDQLEAFVTPEREIKCKQTKTEVDVKCVQHGKIKQVYCVQDNEIICTDCALFTFHRSHQIKSMAALMKAQKEMVDELQQIIKEKQQNEVKFTKKQLESQIFELLDKKKKFMQKQIQTFFKQLQLNLEEKQKQIEFSLDTKMLEMGERIQQNIKSESQKQEEYLEWQKQVQNIIRDQQVEFSFNRDEKLKKLIKRNFNQDKIEEGKQILSKIKLKQTRLIQNLENQLEGLKFSNKILQLFECIDSITLVSETDLKKIKSEFKNEEQSLQLKNEEQLLPCQSKQHINHAQQNKNFHKIYFNHQNLKSNQNQSPCPEFIKPQQNHDYNLLEFTNQILNHPKPKFKDQNLCKTFSFNKPQSSNAKIQQSFLQSQLHKKDSQILNKQPRILNKHQSYQSVEKERPRSINIARSLVRSSSSLSKSSVSNANSKRKAKPNSTHQALISQILQNSIQTIDLTGQQISSQQLFQISKAISQSTKVKSLKMMRNQLPDSFILKCFKNLLNVQRVNLAQNKLTQDSIDCILQTLKSQTNYRLNYLNMGQNWIVERKNRKLLEEFKKLQINIVL